MRVVTRFSDYTDPSTPYMFHYHLLEHEDRGMMGQFVVVGPDDDSGRGKQPPRSADHFRHAAEGEVAGK